ncbi:hypothetical protein CEK26_009899 [Fusarium fujikuroi]|uniref:Uncharacterized protein n=1 Tax=Fusarium fujikuroi TaxID=5127 RepID=A0A5Q3G257_FUSFU|nr:Uncharacterized protein LW94_7534 [Fusarium fujikuroi]QGI65949.1 hypothetical protein CEK27_009920 [Fusarium fujikuroi]QGI83188.1 hypothetical protein CEK25_009917 [Fusarium fujikuroi]QGI96830.1 hypothetical protein CEK26_009899 [Fusarium fujikuroi]VTT59654.1 unnamed protein product [Fusarium fujikuroi]
MTLRNSSPIGWYLFNEKDKEETKRLERDQDAYFISHSPKSPASPGQPQEEGYWIDLTCEDRAATALNDTKHKAVSFHFILDRERDLIISGTFRNIVHNARHKPKSRQISITKIMVILTTKNTNIR